jgi:PAS domain S-box-containing protein
MTTNTSFSRTVTTEFKAVNGANPEEALIAAQQQLAKARSAIESVNDIADQLAGGIGGDFDFVISSDSEDLTVQKLTIMANFLLENMRQAIAERDHAEETLRSRFFLRQVIDLSPDLVYTKDSEGRFVLANEATAALYNLSVDELLGKRESDLAVNGPNIEEARQRVQMDIQVLTSRQPLNLREEKLTRYDGSVRFFQTAKVPVTDADGHVRQMLCFASDITERKQNETELERLVKELRESLLFKDQFMATMSHELRTPLNAILGFAGIGMMQDDVPPSLEKMLDRIKVNAQRLLGLINDILDISRINAGRVEIVSRPLELRETVEGWYTDFKQRAEAKSLNLELVYDDTLPTSVIGDAERLTQIASNLLVNAIKFTDSGKVQLQVKRVGDNKFGIIVTDTGIGIPETWQHLIFEEFRQVDGSSARKYGGAGLGLSIVQKLCLIMDGSITVSSKLGQGSVFTVLLPLKLITSGSTTVK